MRITVEKRKKARHLEKIRYFAPAACPQGCNRQRQGRIPRCSHSSCSPGNGNAVFRVSLRIIVNGETCARVVGRSIVPYAIVRAFALDLSRGSLSILSSFLSFFPLFFFSFLQRLFDQSIDSPLVRIRIATPFLPPLCLSFLDVRFSRIQNVHLGD